MEDKAAELVQYFDSLFKRYPPWICHREATDLEEAVSDLRRKVADAGEQAALEACTLLKEKVVEAANIADFAAAARFNAAMCAILEVLRNARLAVQEIMYLPLARVDEERARAQKEMS